jgi:acyl-homoserine lactone acylase PvdQ
VRLLLAVLILASTAVSELSGEEIQIVRDQFWIPHIFASTAAGAAYGSGYAQAEDRTNQLLTNLRRMGSSGPPPQLSPPIRAIVEAYCAGINAYLQEHQNPARINAAMVVAFSRTAYGGIPDSNDILFAPARSREQAVIAILNPLASWYGASRLYEIEVEAPEDGLAFAGLAPVGVPFPLSGHSSSVAIAVHGAGTGGGAALEQAWAMITAHDLAGEKKALAMAQLPAQKFLIGTADGDIFDSAAGRANPPSGVLFSGGGAAPSAAMTQELAADSHTFSLGTAVNLAFASDVYKAEEWQKRIAEDAPDMEFARMLTGWNRRAEADSPAALGFYLFKMALGGDDAKTLEPPDWLSRDRLRAALRNAQDRLETKFSYQATYGSLFRVGPEEAPRSWPVGGGTVPEAGMYTARSIEFAPRGSVQVGRAGQAALEVVVLAKPPQSVIALPFGESDDPASPHFDDQARELFAKSQVQPTYFGDRKELEKHAAQRKELTFP